VTVTFEPSNHARDNLFVYRKEHLKYYDWSTSWSFFSKKTHPYNIIAFSASEQINNANSTVNTTAKAV